MKAEPSYKKYFFVPLNGLKPICDDVANHKVFTLPTSLRGNITIAKTGQGALTCPSLNRVYILSNIIARTLLQISLRRVPASFQRIWRLPAKL